jgi:hypothetical protein
MRGDDGWEPGKRARDGRDEGKGFQINPEALGGIDLRQEIAVGDARWTCFGKVESSLEMKGELDDEAATVYERI